jgi:uncharacterized protein (UPF0335 family)
MDTLNVIPLYSEEVQKLIDIKNLEEGIKSLYSDLNFLDQKIKEYKSNPLMLTEVQKMVNVTQSRIETLETKIAEITQEIEGIMQKGTIAIFTKSGNKVVLVKQTTVVLESKSIQCWEVKRLDTGKGMICPTKALIVVSKD